jgi:hypothetical protein
MQAWVPPHGPRPAQLWTRDSTPPVRSAAAWLSISRAHASASSTQSVTRACVSIRVDHVEHRLHVRPLSTKKHGALGIVLNQRCRSLRRTSNVSGTERGMLEPKKSFEQAEVGITNKQTNKQTIGCVILNVRLILTVRLKREGFELLFFKIEDNLRCAPLCGLDCILNAITSCGSNSCSALLHYVTEEATTRISLCLYSSKSKC